MSSRKKDEKIEDLKNEYNAVENALKKKDITQTLKGIEDRMEEVLSNSFGNSVQVEFFNEQMLPKYVTTLLRRTDFDEDVPSFVNHFFQAVLTYIVRLIQSDPGDLLDTMSRILSPQCQFYLKYSDEEPLDEDMEIYGSKEEILTTKHDMLDKAQCKKFPAFLISNMEHFVKCGGLKEILDRIKNREPKVPVLTIKYCLKALVKFRDVAFVGMWKPYVRELQSTIFAHILGLTDEELKNENTRVISDTISLLEELMRPILLDDMMVSETIERFSLDVAHKCFLSPYLEKRLAGLNDIREIIASILRKREYDQAKQDKTKIITQQQMQFVNLHLWMTSQFLIDWIKEKQILENLYGGLHAELIKRCIDIPRFMAIYGQLDKKYLDLIWESAQGKHESIIHIIYQSICDNLLGVLPLEELDYMFEKMQKIPYSQYDQQVLNLVRNSTYWGICQNINNVKKKWYGLEIFWALLQDETNSPADIIYSASNTFIEFLGWPYVHTQRVFFMELCLQNLIHSKSVVQSLNILSRIVSTYPEKKIKNADSQSSVIEWLCGTHNLLNLFFTDLVHYKTKAKAAVSQYPAGENIDALVLDGREPHYIQIEARLKFLENVMARCNLTLTTEQIDIFWSSLIVNPLTYEEREMAFKWLENALGKQQTLLEITEYIFVQKVPELDFSSLSTAGFSFFEYFFRYVNWKSIKFQQNDTRDYIIMSFDLIGMDNLWDIALQARDPVVGKQAIDFLNNLHKNLSPNLKPYVGKQREAFIQKCMFNLSEASQDTANISRSELKISRCLSILRAFLDEFEVKMGVGSQKHGGMKGGTPITIKISVLSGPSFELEMLSSDTVGILRQRVSERIDLPVDLLRFITQGKELKEDSETLTQARLNMGVPLFVAKRQKIPQDITVKNNKPVKIATNDISNDEILPSKILSKQEYFDQLFQLLNFDFFAQQVWDLLMLLPTNEKMSSDIVNLQTSLGQVNWDKLLDPCSTFKLLYSLQIVDQQIHDQNDDKEETKKQKDLWKEKFLAAGGLQHLFKIFLTNDFHDKSKGSKRLNCLVLLLKIINFFTLEESEIEKSDVSKKNVLTPPRLRSQLFLSSVDPPTFINKLMEITWYCAAPCPDQKLPAFSYSPSLTVLFEEESDIVQQVMKILVATCLFHQDLLKQMLQHPKIQQWISGMILYTPNEKIRRVFQESILQICKQANNSDLGEYLPHNFFLKMLLTSLLTLSPTTFTSKQYFELLDALLLESCNGRAGGSPSDFTELLTQLVHYIKEHPIVESRTSKQFEDQMLIGLMNLVSTLVSKEPNFRFEVGSSSRMGLIKEVFYTCLFEIPTAENHGPLAPPKCKSKASRKAAFKLLTELARDCGENFNELANNLLEHHKPDEKRTVWQFLPSAYEKSVTGYVGLRNLGATCYMNSLMQQFYMVPEFRRGIFSVPLLEEQADGEKRDYTLYQFQALLANLQEDEKKFYDTREFCRAYKPDGQPINPIVQMDVDEFFNMLFDRLETLLKGSNQQNILKEFFGGIICNQIISKECSHVSEREESYFTISVDIKHKKNLQESLELFVEGDVLEGDNKYHCSQCGKMVDALKRCCISVLPDNLIIHGKRFEFDVEQMKRVKLNDYWEFPMFLDMKPYTKEGLAEKEKPVNDNQQSHPPSYYQYELAGILVHTGTADSGHYYSFIRERIPSALGQERKWFQFNDIDVDQFNPNDIARCCYGGVETTNWDPSGKQITSYIPKIYNAYMLFYERVKPEKTVPPRLLTVEEESKFVPQKIFNKIWEENQAFLIDKNIFDVDYFKFVWNIVMLNSNSTGRMDFVSVNEEDKNFDPLLRSIILGTRFIFVTLSHAKEKSTLREWTDKLCALYSKHIPACRWFLETVINDSTWIRQILLMCTVPETREILARFFVHILACIAPFERDYYLEEQPNTESSMELSMTVQQSKEENGTGNPLIPKLNGIPKSLVVRFMDIIFSLLKDAPNHWNNFAQLFLVMRDFAKFGTAEREYLMTRHAVAQVIDFYLAEDSPIVKKTQQKRKKMGDKSSVPNFNYMLEFISIMIRSCTTNSPEIPSTQIQESTLEFSGPDLELIYDEQFYSRLLHDGINPKACAEIVMHLCWENEIISKKLLDIITNGINVSNHEYFKQYFEVLTSLLNLNDSKQSRRVIYGMELFVKVIYNNLKYKQETFSCINYILTLATGNTFVREWLYENMEIWVPDWFLGSTVEQIRELACTLIQSLVPEYPPLEDGGFPNDIQISEECTNRIHHILRQLLNMLHESYWKVDVEQGKMIGDAEPNDWRLVMYFKILRWYTRSASEKAIFTEYFPRFWKVFINGDQQRNPCDENKKEMIQYWLQNLFDYPENVKLITEQEKYVARILDFFISITPSERQKNYNQLALPSFYRILLLMAQQSPPFLEKLMFHTNFEWAVRYLFLETGEYSHTSNAIFEILKMCANFEKFRTKYITQVIGSNKIHINPVNILRCLEILLKTEDDIINFCYCHGIEQLSSFLEGRYDTERDTETLGLIIQMSLEILIKTTSWMMADKLSENLSNLKFNIMQSWDNRFPLISQIISIMKHFAKSPLLDRCFTMIYHLCALDPLCLSNAARWLLTMFKQELKTQPDAFYIFVRGFIDLAINQESDKDLVTQAVEIAIFLVRDTIATPHQYVASLDVLQRIWSYHQSIPGVQLSQSKQYAGQILIQTKSLDSLVVKLLSTTPIMEDNNTAQFLRLILPIVKERMTKQTVQTLVGVLVNKLQTVISAMTNASQNMDTTSAPVIVSDLIQLLKSLQLFVGEELAKVIGDNKEFGIIIEMTSHAVFAHAPRIDELIALLKDLTSAM